MRELVRRRSARPRRGGGRRSARQGGDTHQELDRDVAWGSGQMLAVQGEIAACIGLGLDVPHELSLQHGHRLVIAHDGHVDNGLDQSRLVRGRPCRRSPPTRRPPRRWSLPSWPRTPDRGTTAAPPQHRPAALAGLLLASAGVVSASTLEGGARWSPPWASLAALRNPRSTRWMSSTCGRAIWADAGGGELAPHDPDTWFCGSRPIIRRDLEAGGEAPKPARRP